MPMIGLALFIDVQYVFMAIAVPLVVLIALIVAVLGALPANAQVLALGGDAIDGRMGALIGAFESLGFVRVNPPMQVVMMPPATLVGLVHEETGAFATVFRAGGSTGQLGYDVVSILESGADNGLGYGALTTTPKRNGALLPPIPGCFAQVFPDQPPAELFSRHLEALEYLHEQGMPIRPIRGEELVGYLRQALAGQRRVFLKRPLRNILLILWRMATRTTPHLGPIRDQPAVQEAVQLDRQRR